MMVLCKLIHRLCLKTTETLLGIETDAIKNRAIALWVSKLLKPF